MKKLELDERGFLKGDDLMKAHEFCEWLEKNHGEWLRPLYINEPKPCRTVGMTWNYCLDHRPEFLALWRMGL